MDWVAAHPQELRGSDMFLQVAGRMVTFWRLITVVETPMATAISTKLKPSLEKMPTKKRTMLISDLLLSMTRLRSSSPSISKITQEILREDSRHYELSTCSEKKIHTIIANSSPLKFQYTYSHNTVMAIGPKSLWGRIANFTFTVVISKRMFSQNWSVRS